MVVCSQCGRPAIVKIQEHPLCVDCNYKVQMAEWMRYEQYASHMNFLLDHAEAVTGVYGVVNRMHIPPPPAIVQGGQMVFNNIRVSNSVIGVVNTGDVKSIDSVVTTVKGKGDEKLAIALRDFTQAVLDTQDLPQENKNEVLSQLSFLSQQIVTEPKQAPSVMRSILSGIERGIHTSASLVTMWPLLYALLKAALNA
jgi:hypothetical protein